MKDMKKILNIFLAGVVLVAGLASCSGNKEQLTTGDTVDLRYRVADSYDLDAISPKSFCDCGEEHQALDHHQQTS